jgi:hypothetical protein
MVAMRLACRGDLERLIAADHPIVSRAEVYGMLDRLARMTTGLPLRDLVRRPEVTKKALATQKKLGR